MLFPYTHYFTKDGFTEIYSDSNILHNEKCPAWICYDEYGNIGGILWYINGKKHRNDKPAYILINNGNIRHITYIIHGNIHNEDGPTRIWYEDNGNIRTSEWWLNSLCVAESYTEFKKFIFKNKEKYLPIYEKILKEDAVNIFD